MSGHRYELEVEELHEVFQSPDGDSLCPDQNARIILHTGESVFQSPDGDSLCPDGSVVLPQNN